MLDVPRDQIERWWEFWLLYRNTGRDIPAFLSAAHLPKSMIDTFSFLDNFYTKMELQYSKKADSITGKPNGR